MCKDTYVPQKFLFRMFITYLIYRYYYKDKKGCEEKNEILNLLLGKLCCFVVKLIKLKVICQWKDNCKLHYLKHLHYFTLPNCSIIFFKTYSTTIEHELQTVQCIHIYNFKLQM